MAFSWRGISTQEKVTRMRVLHCKMELTAAYNSCRKIERSADALRAAPSPILSLQSFLKSRRPTPRRQLGGQSAGNGVFLPSGRVRR